MSNGYLDARALLHSGPCGPGKHGEKVCFSDDAFHKIKNHADITGNKPMMDKIKNVMLDPNAKAQRDLLYDEGTTAALGEEFIDELINGFRVPAPQGNKLFSNFNENLILKQLHAIVPTFHNFDCVLMDFYDDEQNPLTRIMDDNSEFIRGVQSGEILTFGTIPNTLVSRGDISKVGHWVALFGDFREDEWTIEYYNSTGNNAPKGMFNWMQQLAQHLQSNCGHKCIAVNVSNVASQKGPTECGIYSMHYLICRLIGIDYKAFRANKIPDNEINKIRKIFANEADTPNHIKKLLRSYNLM